MARAASEKLKELLGIKLIEPPKDNGFYISDTVECDGYTKLSFEFKSEENYTIPCKLLVPKGKKLPLPAVICLQGHTTGMHISLDEKKFPQNTDDFVNCNSYAIQAVKNGYCAVTFDQRYMGDAGHDKNGNPECITSNAVFRTFLMGRTAIGERVWDVERLIDIIEAHFSEYIDVSRIICLGHSGGGTATFYSACLESRIYLAVISCALCTYDDSIIKIWHCPCNIVPGVRQYFDMGDLGTLIAPRKAIVYDGENDEIFPLNGAEKSFEIIKEAYKKVGAEENCLMVTADVGHSFSPDIVWNTVNKIL